MPSSDSKIDGVVRRPGADVRVDPRRLVYPKPDALDANPRDEDIDFEELIPSIRAHGVLEPIKVWKNGEGRLEIINGQRRHKAVMWLIEHEQVPILSIPAMIEKQKPTPEERLVMALNTNLGKRLTPREQAKALYKLTEVLGWSYDKAAEETGVSVQVVRDRLALLQAVPVVTAAQHNGSITTTDVVKIVRKAEREGTTQDAQLQQVQTTKAKRTQTPRPRNVEETITQRLARLEDDYGFELVQQIAQKRYV